MNSSGSNLARRSETIRVWLLGGFRVSVGSRAIAQDAWPLKKAAVLVKLLALAPGHRLHREQAMDILWPNAGRKAASNSLRSNLHAARKFSTRRWDHFTWQARTSRWCCVRQAACG